LNIIARQRLLIRGRYPPFVQFIICPDDHASPSRAYDIFESINPGKACNLGGI
jgi:hypothetical protein